MCSEQGCLIVSADGSRGLVTHSLLTSLHQLPVLENKDVGLNELLVSYSFNLIGRHIINVHCPSYHLVLFFIVLDAIFSDFACFVCFVVYIYFLSPGPSFPFPGP